MSHPQAHDGAVVPGEVVGSTFIGSAVWLKLLERREAELASGRVGAGALNVA